ncbi:MAG TPA: L,D-transpeptidase family protein [Lautropia sp.]|nr:L,D-transpeptidase family protein [Lautropia sp.]
MRSMRLIVMAALLSVAGPAGAGDVQFAQHAEWLLIDKSDRTLTVAFEDGSTRTLRDLRFGPNWNAGPKRQRGDRRTPEGEYRVLEHRVSRDLYPDVTYLPALYLDYPNAQDQEVAAALGVDPGDAIMIHGPHPDVPASVLRAQGDWTEGCVAVTASQMNLLIHATREGTPVTIRP